MAKANEEVSAPFYKGFSVLQKVLETSAQKSTKEILKALLQFSKMMDNQLKEAKFADELKMRLTSVELTSCANAYLTLTDEIRLRGKKGFKERDEISTIEQALALENICWATILLKQLSNAALVTKAVGGLREAKEHISAYDNALDNARGLKYQILARYHEDDLIDKVKETPLEIDLRETLLQPKHETPSKVTYNEWKSGSLPPKMWRKLLTNEDKDEDYYYTSAPNKKCGICNKVEIKIEDDFAILDACNHIFCIKCVEKKFKMPVDGFCQCCNKMIVSWIPMSTMRQDYQNKKRNVDSSLPVDM